MPKETNQRYFKNISGPKYAYNYPISIEIFFLFVRYSIILFMKLKIKTLIICILTICCFILTGILPVPQLLAVEKDTTIYDFPENEMVHLRWKDMGEGITYQCQISKDKGFQRILLDSKCEKPEITFPRPDASGTYYMRVRPISPEGQKGKFLQAQTFEIISTLQPPLILSPEEIAEITDIFDVDVKWSNVPNAAGYHIILARDRLFKNIIFEKAKITGTFIRIRNLDYSTYFLKISSISKDGTEGPFTDVRSFIIVPHPRSNNPAG
jgi:hypothetical protein